MECDCRLRSIQDFMSRWENSVRKKIRHAISWAKDNTFGTKIFYHPTSTKDKHKLHQFSSKVINSIFIGNALNARSGWTGDLLVAEAEEKKDNTAPEARQKLQRKRKGNATRREQLTFPGANNSEKLSQEGSNRHTSNPSSISVAFYLRHQRMSSPRRRSLTRHCKRTRRRPGSET